MCLSTGVIPSLPKSQVVLDQWRMHYNFRGHSPFSITPHGLFPDSPMSSGAQTREGSHRVGQKPALARAAIVGAGFAGLCAAIKLLEARSDDFVIFEKAASLGGTWRDNTYPGCGCDIPSHLYSFSFAQHAGWSRTYASQAEILSYIKEVAKHYGIERKVLFNTDIVAATWDEAARVWRLSAQDGRQFTARAVIAATGSLHLPKVPRFEGAESFLGPAFHSARWRQDVDLTGKRVAVIGTGASAIQFVPQIAPRVTKLHLFQRSPPWVLPRNDRTISRFTKHAFTRLPLVQRMWRAIQYWNSEKIAIGFTIRPKMMGSWQKKSDVFMRSIIKDRMLADKLMPMYTMGCKRVLISDDFYPTMTRDNVELVTEPIREVRPTGIVTADGKEREVDVIIYATGFKPFNIAESVRIEGRNGRLLADDWRDGPEAFYGVAVSGYPNFFMLMGPNSALGHNSIIFMIEAQVRYILQCLDWLDEGQTERRLETIEVREDAQRSFNSALRKHFDRSVWKSDGSVWQLPCTSWYVHESGKNHVLWPGFSVSYWWAMRKPCRRHFLADMAGPNDRPANVDVARPECSLDARAMPASPTLPP